METMWSGTRTYKLASNVEQKVGSIIIWDCFANNGTGLLHMKKYIIIIKKDLIQIIHVYIRSIA